MFKALLVLVFLAAVISLFSGLFYILRDRGQSSRTVHALTLRIVFCMLLLLLLVYGIYSGQLMPNHPWAM